MGRIAAGTVDAKEILDSGGEVARIVGMLLGGQGETGKVPAFLVRHGGRTGGEKLCHAGDCLD